MAKRKSKSLQQQQKKRIENLHLEPSEMVQTYLGFMRTHEVWMLVVFFLVVELAIVSITYKNYKEKTQRYQLQTWNQNKNYDKLFNYYAELLEENPKSWSLEVRTIRYASKNGDHDYVIDKGEKIAPPPTRSRDKFRDRFNLLSKAHYLKGDKTLGWKYAQLAIRANSIDTETRRLVARSLVERDQLVEAAEWLEWAYNENPTAEDRKLLNEIQQKLLADLSLPGVESDTPPKNTGLTNEKILSLLKKKSEKE